MYIFLSVNVVFIMVIVVIIIASRVVATALCSLA